MELNLDFHYQISCLPARCTNKRHATAAASTTVTVREVSSQDAPVAMMVGNVRDAASADKYSMRYQVKEDGSLRKVRLFEGRLFVEAVAATELTKKAESALAETFFGRCQPINSMIGKERGQSLQTIDELVRSQSRHHPGQMQAVTDDGGAQVAAKLAKLADLMIVVDGTVYEYTPEPILALDRYANERVTLVPTHMSGERYGASDHFDFHRYSSFSKGTLGLAHADRADEVFPCMELPDFELIIPSSSRYDGATHDAMELVDALARDMRTSVTAMPWNQVEAYYALRDAVEDASGRVTPRLVSALEAVSHVGCSDSIDHTASAAAFHVSEDRYGGGADNQRISARARHDASDSAQRFRDTARAAILRWDARACRDYWENGIGHVSSVTHGGLQTFEVLSAGQLAEMAAFLGIDAAPALDAARQGSTVIAARQSGLGYVGIGIVDASGSVEILMGDDDATHAIVGHPARCAKRIDAATNLLDLDSHPQEFRP